MTAASGALSTPASESTWVDRYERLRQRGLELGSRCLEDARGLVLFLRRGMVSWMTELAHPTQQPPARPPRADRGVLVCDHRMEVTRMLASMVGSAASEVPA